MLTERKPNLNSATTFSRALGFTKSEMLYASFADGFLRSGRARNVEACKNKSKGK
jgi:hypothetical protein